MSKLEIGVGDILFHHTDKPFEHFNPDTGNVVYLGRSKESIELVGGVGFLLLFQVIDSLGKTCLYGSRDGLGIKGDWISVPCELAAESLQLVDTIQEYSTE